MAKTRRIMAKTRRIMAKTKRIIVAHGVIGALVIKSVVVDTSDDLVVVVNVKEWKSVVAVTLTHVMMLTVKLVNGHLGEIVISTVVVVVNAVLVLNRRIHLVMVKNVLQWKKIKRVTPNTVQ
jgi:hypothetical protein